MNAYLFAWNPEKWPWPELEADIRKLKRTGHLKDQWTCVSHRKVQMGDRAFLVKVGKKPAGLMGSGYIVSGPVFPEHPVGERKTTPRVTIDFDVLLNPVKDQVLSVDLLKMGRLASQLWTPQSSGISINRNVIDELEALWQDFLSQGI